MTHKPHQKRQRPFSERNQVFILAGFAVAVVLALLALFFWWTNSPFHGSN